MSEHDDTPAPPQSSGWTPIMPLGGSTSAEFPPPPVVPLPSASTAVSAQQTRSPGSSGRTARVSAGVLAVLGGLLIVAGSFLDWVRADIVGEGIVFASGWSNISGSVADGPIIAALGALIVMWGAITLAGPITGRWVIADFVASGSASAVVIYEIVDLTTPGAGIATELQAGVWVMAAGCVAALIAAVVAGLSVRAGTRSRH